MKTAAIFLLCAVSCMLQAQVETRTPTENEIPQFFVDALSFSSDDSLSSRVDVYVQIPYDALQFVKSAGKYRSQYEIMINILTDENSLVSEKVWNDEVTVPTFDETQSKKAYSLSQRSVLVVPGIYTLRVQLRDNESKKVTTIVKKIVVGNYSGSGVTVSDILLVNKLTVEGERKNIVPNISGNLSEASGMFYLFYEIYSPVIRDSVEIHYVIADAKGGVVSEKYQTFRMTALRSQILARFDSSNFPMGSFIITLDVKPFHEVKDFVPPVKQKAFVIKRSGMPVNINDLDLAIRQLRYIAHDKEYDDIENAKTEEEKRRLFEEFWRRRDRNPDTKQNEFMEEYYSRVQYANEHFSNYMPGWKTDMGMVFILLGSPNSVERHPFDIDSKPYEVWTYYDFNKQVVFIDETGFGDYRLLTPIWDILQRLKY